MNPAAALPSSARLPPSTFSLRESLVRLDVCRERDFRRCRRRVRRLARGIPAFDFVWIDALRHAGAITPFQAKILESSPPEKLRMGPCVLVDRLGGGEFSQTYVATTPGSPGKVVLKRVCPPPEMSAVAAERLKTLIEAIGGLDNPFVIGPHFLEQSALNQHGADLILLSRHAAGPDCLALLVRRGRFPVDVVAQIARQLAAGLAALESRGCLHGQIQLPNVRLTAEGHAVLVDAGVSACLERGLLLRSDVPPETYEGTAPERIGTGNSQTTATEIYAFGCLLWQLLAGRPPFPTGDPLGKLAAHRTREVPDIREFAPDTPTPLAEAVRALTQLDPCRRPATFAEVTARFGSINPPRNRRLQQFRKQFDTAAPLEKSLSIEPVSRISASAVVALLLVLSGIGWAVNESGSLSRLVRLRPVAALFSKNSSRAADKLETTTNDRGQLAGDKEARLRPLPSPDANGIAALGEGAYAAGTLSSIGDLTIRGTGEGPSTIFVSGLPLSITSRKFRIEHVVLRREASSASGEADRPTNAEAARPLLAIQSQEVFLERCAFLVGRVEQTQKPLAQVANRGAAIVWKGVEARDPDAGRIRLSNSLFINEGAAIFCDSPPGRLEAENCLKVGGYLFDLPQSSKARDVTLSARQLTLRNAASLCSIRLSDAARKTQVRAVLDDCVFDLAGGGAALFRVTNTAPVCRQVPAFVVTGSGSVIRPGIPVVAWSNRPSTGPGARVFNTVVEGLAVGDFRFAGAAGLSASGSAVVGRSLEIPRGSDVPPGIVPERLALVVASVPAPLRAQKPHGSRPLAN